MKLEHLKHSILVKFIICALISIFYPLFHMSVIARQHIQKIEQNTAYEYLSANLDTVSSNIDGIINNMENFYLPLLTDREFITAVQKLSPYEKRDEYQDFLDTTRIRDMLSKTASFNNYIYSIYAYSYPANRFFSSKVRWDPSYNDFDKDQSDWLLNFEKNNPAGRWILTVSEEDGRQILTNYRMVKQNAASLDGIISINIDAAVISGQLENIIPNQSCDCFMTDSDFNIISSSISNGKNLSVCEAVLNVLQEEEKEGLFSLDMNGETMFVFSSLSADTNFHYFIVTSRENINKISSMTLRLVLSYFAFVLVLVLFLTVLSVLIFFRPIKQLFVGMTSVQKGDFSTRLPQNSNYEINYINEHFNSMAENIQQLIRENYEQQLQRKDAEIRNIQTQLNEHFLYNTLDSIRWNARVEDAPRTSKMVYSLAAFYRINLSSGKDFIPLSQIAQMLRSYLDLQEIRMNSRFTYTLTCDPLLYNISVLKYLFQPIVENSLVHGFDGTERHLDINICFEISDDLFCFTVTDNGAGISLEKKKEIENSILNSSETEDFFALKMICKQILLEYQMDNALFINTTPGESCTVGFCIPLSRLGGVSHDSDDYN